MAAYVWYKWRTGAVSEDQVAVLEGQHTVDTAAVAAAQDAAIKQAGTQIKELSDEAKQILEMAESDARHRAALDLLARLRGTR